MRQDIIGVNYTGSDASEFELYIIRDAITLYDLDVKYDELYMEIEGTGKLVRVPDSILNSYRCLKDEVRDLKIKLDGLDKRSVT